MKGVKCFGLLLVFFIMFGFSLSVSSDANALKYSFNAFPLYQSVVSSDSDTYFSTNPTFGFWFSDNVSSDIDVSGLKTWGCSDILDSDIWSNFYSNFYDYTSLVSGSVSGFIRPFWLTSNDCNTFTQDYDYDSVYGAMYNVSSGDIIKVVDIEQEFFNSDISTPGSRSLKRLDIPLNINPSSVGSVSANTPLYWEFGLSTAHTGGFSFFDSNVHYSFSVDYFDSNGVAVSDTASCSLDDDYIFLVVHDDMSFASYEGFNLHCSYTPSTSADYINAHLTMYGGTDDYNPSSFLTYSISDGLVFNASYFVTNNDDTWSGLNANYAPTGSALTSAPGYSSLYCDNAASCDSSSCPSGDFICLLTQSFNFSFSNPFLPIFNLFSSGDTCASIPVLAGFIHSSETTICPFFSSSVRSVLTPVFGFASLMIVFGFLVRWLGSSSGNMFEDQTSHKWSNTQPKGDK